MVKEAWGYVPAATKSSEPANRANCKEFKPALNTRGSNTGREEALPSTCA